jgi:hypothetical protein
MLARALRRSIGLATVMLGFPLLTAVAEGAAPAITSALSADVTYDIENPNDAMFSYWISASGTPTHYAATGLPPRSTVDATTGLVLVNRDNPGVFNVALSASNSDGTGNATLRLAIHPAVTAVTCSNDGVYSIGAMVRVTLHYNASVVVGGQPVVTLVLGTPAGVEFRPARYLGGTGTNELVFAYTVAAGDFDPDGVGLLGAIDLNGGTIGSFDGLSASTKMPLRGFATGVKIDSAAPRITSALTAEARVAEPFAYEIAASISPARFAVEGLPPGLSLDPASGRISGVPTLDGHFLVTLQAADASGANVIGTLALDVSLTPLNAAAAAPQPSRLINLSSRAEINGSDPSRAFIAGFVVSGTAPQPMVLRAVGDALKEFSIERPAMNPQLRVYDEQGRVVLENDNWTGADMKAVFARVGAFPLAAGSGDAAVFATLPPGRYSLQVVPAANAGGVALAEIYDASDSAATSEPRLINISTRAFVDAGEGVLVAGFAVSGDAPKRLLVRGIGPALAAYDVANALPDPALTLYADGQVVARNDDWQMRALGGASTAEVAAAANAAGAFPIAAGSKDAAMLVTLSAGIYSAVVSGANGSSGVGLIEVYELAP